MSASTAFVTLFPPLHRVCTDPDVCRSSTVDIKNISNLPFSMKGSTATFMTKNYVSTIRNAIKDDWHKESLSKLKDSQRDAVENMCAVQLAVYSQFMDENLMTEDDDWSRLKNVIERSEGNCLISWEREDPRIDTLLYQLGYNNDKDYAEFFQELPLRKEFLSSLLWKTRGQNRLIFETSAHADNIIALESGDRLHCYLQEHVQPAQGAPNRSESVFKEQFDLEMSLLRHNMLSPPDSNYLLKYETPRFLGCIGETVRSVFAEWVDRRDPESHVSGWNANLSLVPFKFMCSNQLCSSFADLAEENAGQIRSFNMRLLWEVQAALQWTVSEESTDPTKDIRASSSLVMLFLLGFPSLKMDSPQSGSLATESETCSSLEFNDVCTLTPIGGPQKIQVELAFCEEAKMITAVLQTRELVFNWQDWKDAFMGILSARKLWRSTRLFSKHEEFCEKSSQSTISDPVTCITRQTLGLSYNLTYWTGWPPFLPRIAQFEMKKLMHSLNPKCEPYLSYDKCEPKIFLEHIGYLKAAIEKSTRSKDSKSTRSKDSNLSAREFTESLHQDGDRALSDGNEIDLQMLANYFERFSETTYNNDSLRQVFLGLFHSDGSLKPVNNMVLAAGESFLLAEQHVTGNKPQFCFNLKCYLAIGYQSRFHYLRFTSDRDTAARYMLELGTHKSSAMESYLLSIGYLLEKGFYSRSESHRKDKLISTFNTRGIYGDERRLEAMFDLLFVKRSGQEPAPSTSSEFGIGKHPQYAIKVYRAMKLKSDNSNRSSFSRCLNRLGMLYHIGASGVPVSKPNAKELYEESISELCEDALTNMGVLNYNFLDANPDISFTERAAVAKISTGMNNRAIIYELDKTAGKAEELYMAAEKLYKAAIEKDGSPLAMYNLAVLYKWGDLRFRNAKKISWARKTVELLARTSDNLTPMSALENQVKLMLRTYDVTMDAKWEVNIEEIGDSLGYLKILKIT